MNMPLGERIIAGLGYSVTGMTITIATLILLSLFILVLSKSVAAVVSGRAKSKSGNGDGSSGGSQAGGSQTIGSASAAGDNSGVSLASVSPVYSGMPGAVGGVGGYGGDSSAAVTADGELIAVFAAAITAVRGGAPFRITSFRRAGQSAPVWNLRGRSDYISGKLS